MQTTTGVSIQNGNLKGLLKVGESDTFQKLDL